MFVYSCNCTRERSKVINPGSERLTVRKHFFYRNLPKFLKDSKQTSFHLARKYARLFTLHGRGYSCLREAFGSSGVWSKLATNSHRNYHLQPDWKKENYSFMWCFAAAASLKSEASDLSDWNFSTKQPRLLSKNTAKTFFR